MVEVFHELCIQHKFRLGYRKITALVKRTQKVDHKVIQKIMKVYGLQYRVKPKKLRITGQPASVAAHHLNREFSADRPLQKLVIDITYLLYVGKMLYLSSIQDLYNGEIVAYTISDKHNVDCVLDILNQLPDLTSECLIHSDQGAVYTSHAYQETIKRKGITMNMSRKGTPADNILVE